MSLELPRNTTDGLESKKLSSLETTLDTMINVAHQESSPDRQKTVWNKLVSAAKLAELLNFRHHTVGDTRLVRRQIMEHNLQPILGDIARGLAWTPTDALLTDTFAVAADNYSAATKPSLSPDIWGQTDQISLGNFQISQDALNQISQAAAILHGDTKDTTSLKELSLSPELTQVDGPNVAKLKATLSHTSTLMPLINVIEDKYWRIKGQQRGDEFKPITADQPERVIGNWTTITQLLASLEYLYLNKPRNLDAATNPKVLKESFDEWLPALMFELAEGQFDDKEAWSFTIAGSLAYHYHLMQREQMGKVDSTKKAQFTHGEWTSARDNIDVHLLKAAAGYITKTLGWD